MRGSLFVFTPGDDKPAIEELDAPPRGDRLHELVDGYFELVPHFDAIKVNGEWRRCVAFCNEHGKLNGLAFNVSATAFWLEAIARNRRGDHPLIADYLVGPVVVVMGDDDLMRQL
jgi:hypothetical protein